MLTLTSDYIDSGLRQESLECQGHPLLKDPVTSVHPDATSQNAVES